MIEPDTEEDADSNAGLEDELREIRDIDIADGMTSYEFYQYSQGEDEPDRGAESMQAYAAALWAEWSESLAE